MVSPISQKIVAPQGMYHGVFANHYTDSEHLACFEEMAGEKADISLRSIDFRELSSNQPFPTAEAERMRKRGGALHLVLRPGNGKRSFDNTYSPGRIIGGHHDEQLEAFAEGAVAFGGPVFVSLRSPRDTQYDPKLIKAAYTYIRKKVIKEGAKNITWVWNVNLDDPDFASNYPEKDQVDWVSVSLYQTNENNFANVIEKLEENIDRLRRFNKPIMVEFGSNAPPAQKAEFIKNAMAKFKELGIKAFTIDNVSQREGSRWRTWAVSAAQERGAYKEAVTAHERFLRENIITRAGELAGSPTPIKDLDCSVIDGHYFTAAKAYRITGLNQEIQRLEGTYKTRGRVPLEYLSDQRLKLCRAYREYSGLTRNKTYLNKAIQALEGTLKNPIYNISFGTDKHPYVDKYFDLRLELAETYRLFNNSKALNESKEIISALEGEDLLDAQNVDRNSMDGYENRAKLIMGQAYYGQGNFARAEECLSKVVSWSASEAQLNWLSLWLKGEYRDDVLYNGAKANLLIGFVKINKKDGNLDSALSIFRHILSWEKAGEEEGFMDLAFESLIGSMLASLQSSPNLESAKKMFRKELPWDRINGYSDLKRALQCEGYNLEEPNIDLWETILEGLTMVDFNPGLRANLMEIQILTETQGEN